MLTRRLLLGAGVCALATPVAPLFAAEHYDCVVDTYGHGDVLTLAEAFTRAPDVAGAAPYRILLKRGIYAEKLNLAKPNVWLEGEGQDVSVISAGMAASMIAPDGQPYGTQRTATLTVTAPNFTARNLTLRNSFDYVGTLVASTANNGAQGLAFALEGYGDRAHLENVNFEGYQDTLFADAGMSRFLRCRISGAVDFIFGAGRVLFENCEIVSRARPNKPIQGYIAAPSTLNSSPVGFVFWHCRLTKEGAVPAASVTLGRPWHAGNNAHVSSAAAFLHCWMDDHIAPGWSAMGPNQPEDARFFEFDSSGPGGGASPHRRLLTAEQARAYAPDSVLGAWR